MVLNLANQITLARVFFVIPIVILLHFEGPLTCLVASGLFCVASFTDFLDGFVARRENMVTSFGKFLDPLADKILICSVLIMFVALGWVEAWVTIVIVGRELAVTGLRAMAVDEGVVIAADKYGKLKTVLQILAIIPLTIHYEWLHVDFHLLGNFFLYMALLLTVFSGANYCIGFHTSWKRKHGASA